MPGFNIKMTGRSAGQEISSTYEGRHITALESYITHPVRDSGLVVKGDPVLVGDIIVGVALNSASAATDHITIDTEGIWALTVRGQNDAGNVAVAEGDQIYINRTTCILSKHMNKSTHRRFGYAMSPANSGTTTTVCAVKVHFDPIDAEEIVGVSGTAHTSAVASKIFRDYRYQNTAASGHARGVHVHFRVAGTANGGDAIRAFTTVAGSAAEAARGAHISLNFVTAGKVTGLGAAMDATLHLPNAVMAANGTYVGVSSDIHSDGATTDPTAVTTLAFYRASLQGNATGVGVADDKVALISIEGNAIGAGNMVFASAKADGTHLARILINGVPYYIMLVDAA